MQVYKYAFIHLYKIAIWKYAWIQIPCMQVCIELSNQASRLLCKYANKQVIKYAHMKVGRYALIQVGKYSSIQVWMYASMQVWK